MAGLTGRPVRVSVRSGSGPAEATARTIDPASTGAVISPAGSGRVRLVGPDAAVVSALVDGRPALGPRQPARLEVVVRGWRFELEVEDAGLAALRDRARRDRPDAETGGRTEVRAMISGRIASVAVAAGSEVQPGQVLLVVEAMKMQNDLAAPGSGPAVVERVAVAAGDTVELGDLLVVLEGPA